MGAQMIATILRLPVSIGSSKGSNLTGIDPETGQIVELFHPRIQSWKGHFAWHGERIAGLTDVGRVTIHVMDLNSDDRLIVRLVSYRSKS
jgi:hypothetical protein